MFNLKFIRGAVLLAVMALLAVPVYLFAYLAPYLHAHVVGESRQEAIQIASHLSSMLLGSSRISIVDLTPDLLPMVDGVLHDFHLQKLKIYDASGQVVFSTNPKEIGTVNRSSYFHQEIATGQNLSNLVQKEQFTLDGEQSKLDLVEAYVPVMRDNHFAGALQIHFDVSPQLADLHQLIIGFYKVILPIIACLLVVIAVIILRFRDNFIKRLTTERRLKENEERYRNLFECSNDAILVCERDGSIQEVNEMACRMLGIEQSKLVGMKLWELVVEEERGDPVPFMARLLERGELGLDTYVVKENGELLDVDIRVGVTNRKNGILQAIIKDVSAQRKSEREVKRGYHTQTVLNKLLHLSLENLSLTETMELFIYYVTSFPWLVLEPKGAIFLVGDNPDVLELKAHRGLNESLQTICSQVPFGTCHCGRCALSGEIVFSNCLDHSHDHKYEGIAQHGHYCVPIFSAKRKLIGVFTLYIKHQAKRERLVEETLEAAASVVAGVIQRKMAEEELQKSRDRLEVRVQERTVELEEANIQLGQELTERWTAEKALAQANQDKDNLIVNLFEIMYEMLANRDHSTFEHALRVAEISKRIGNELQLPVDEMEALRLGCLVHDIGKVAIPDDVLLKPGLFDRMDRNIMRVHPLVGASLFAKHHHDNRIRRIILHHHERLDGTGYPYGLKGDEIGLLERIVAVADVFEALTAKRPYKKPIDRDKAVEILWYEAREGRLDESIVEILEKITIDWNSLEIVSEFRADYSEDLEIFRQMSYFREPLSDFYNYRYLLYLDDAKMLADNGRPYNLIFLSFPKIEEFNHGMGFIKADQVVDEIGQKLHQTAEDLDILFSKDGGSVMLLKKGSDFLIYTPCGEEQLAVLLREITSHREIAKNDWGLNTELRHFQFDCGFPAEMALNQVFSAT